MQKLTIITLIIFGAISTTIAQNVGIGTATPEPSAKLDITSTNSGLMIPRVSLNDVTDGITPVNTPATGLLVFNNNASVTGGSGIGFYYWDGSQWARMEDINSSGGGTAGWQLTGNGGTNPTNNFLGTTDAQDLVFRTNNTEKMRVASNGDVGVAIANPARRLHIKVEGNDGIAITNNTTGSSNTDGLSVGIEANHDAYIWQQENAILRFATNGTERVRIAANGRVGVGTAAPSNLFHVNSAVVDNQIMRLSAPIEADVYYVTPSGTWQAGTNSSGNGTNGNQFFIYDNAYRLTVQQGTGRVGIGTNYPASRLHVVNGGGTAAAPNGFIVNSNGAGVTSGWGAYINGGGGAFTGHSLIELRGGTPYIDFNGTSVGDYDIRLIRDATNRLVMAGGQLFVNGFRNENFNNVGTFIENFFGTGDLSFANGSNPYSIRASHWVIGSVFACYSDKRIKKDIRLANSASSLDVLRGIEVTHYKHRDYISNGKQERMGFIAQQVETTFPEAVTKMKNVVPNIYQVSNSYHYDKEKSTLTIDIDASIPVKAGDAIQIVVNEDVSPREFLIAKASGGTVTIADWTEEVEQLFIYGTSVDDFRAVDYDRVFILGISAIQELDKKVNELEALKGALKEQQAKLARIEAKLGINTKSQK